MILVHPAYRRGFFVKKDLDSPWIGKFDWKVTCPEYCAGWFSSLEAAYDWIYRDIGGLL